MNDGKRPFLSVCIITGNEEKDIARCLESVKFADEIVVVDSFSTDRTVEIASTFTDRVFQHRWMGYIGQKAIARNLARGEWILFVDADEAVSDELRKEIVSTLGAGVSENIAGFDFPRQVWYLHRWIRHGDWYPDAKLRLFRKERGHCCGTEPHERIDVDGDVAHLSAPLLHYTYDDIADQLSTVNRFSTISSKNEKLLSRPTFDLVWRILLHPPFRFFRCYFVKKGFLDGMAGLVIAVTIAFGTFIKYAKVWEARTERKFKNASNALTAVVAVLLAASAARYAEGGAPEAPFVAPPPVLETEAEPLSAAADDAASLLASCAERMPRERVLMTGSVNMRRRYGVSIKEFGFSADADFSASPQTTIYRLGAPDGGVAQTVRAVRDPSRGLVLSGVDGAPGPEPADSVGGTDIAWFDVGFDFVWWRALRLSGEDRVKGRDCILLDVAPPEPSPECAFVRLWVDAEMRFVVQAAQFDENGAERRRLWVRGVKKHAGRWVVGDIEVETVGTGHRTRLHFDDFSFPTRP